MSSYLFLVHWCFTAILTIVKPKAWNSESKARVQVQSPISSHRSDAVVLCCAFPLNSSLQLLLALSRRDPPMAPRCTQSMAEIEVGTQILHGCFSFQKHTCKRLNSKEGPEPGRTQLSHAPTQKPLINTSLFLHSSCISEIKLPFGQHFSALSCPV